MVRFLHGAPYKVSETSYETWDCTILVLGRDWGRDFTNLMRRSYNGIITAFQAEDASSILARRSIIMLG